MIGVIEGLGMFIIALILILVGDKYFQKSGRARITGMLLLTLGGFSAGIGTSLIMIAIFG